MEQRTFFESEMSQPLAARLRPQTIEEYVGQKHLLGEGKVLRRLIESDNISSMIFWGAARSWQDYAGAYNSKQNKGGFYRFFSGHERY